MTITHRIARAAAREVTLREATARDVAARNEETRASYRAAATEQFPPTTPAEKKAVLDLNKAGLPAGVLIDEVRRRYGVDITRFRMIVVQLTTDLEAIQGQAGECKRIARIINRPADRRAARRARLSGGAA